MSGALAWRRDRAVREVRRREKMVGRGRWERTIDWISDGSEKKRVPSWLCFLSVLSRWTGVRG